MDNFGYAFQMILFWGTFFGGIVCLFCNKWIPLPLWGIIVIWIVLMVLQCLFVVAFSWLTTIVVDDEDIEKPQTDDEINRAIQQELAELHSQNQQKKLQQ